MNGKLSRRKDHQIRKKNRQIRKKNHQLRKKDQIRKKDQEKKKEGGQGIEAGGVEGGVEVMIVVEGGGDHVLRVKIVTRKQR